jgi:hypothetical protein
MSRLHWIESGKLVVQHGHLWYYVLVPMSLVLLLTGIIFSQVFHPFIQLYEIFQTSTKLDASILMELKKLAIRSVALMLPYILISSLLVFVAFLSLIRAIYAVYLNKKFIFKQNIRKTLLDIIPGLVLLTLLVTIVVVNVYSFSAVQRLGLWWLDVIMIVLSGLIIISCWLFSFHFFIIKGYDILRSIWESIKLIPNNFLKMLEAFAVILITIFGWICLFANVYTFGKFINIYLGFFWGMGMIIFLIPITLLIMIYLSLVFFDLSKL